MFCVYVFQSSLSVILECGLFRKREKKKTKLLFRKPKEKRKIMMMFVKSGNIF